MWNPNVPLKKWLKMYPNLRSALPFECPCGKELEVIPYISSEWIGIETKNCECGSKTGYVSGFERNKEKAKETFQNFLELNDHV